MVLPFHTAYNPWTLLCESTFPEDQELAALKSVMDGEKASKKYLKAGMEKINARTLYDIIVWGLRTGIIHDKPIKGVHPEMFRKEGFYEGYPMWYFILNQIVTGNKPDLPKSQIEHYQKWIDQKFNLNGTDAQRIRFALAALSPIEPPKKTQADWRPWTKSTTSLMRIPQTHTGADIDPEGSITKETPVLPALKLLGIKKDEIPKARSRSESGSFWNRSHETLYHMLELAKQRRDGLIKKLHPFANRIPQNPDQEKQSKMAEKQLAVINAAWDRIRMLFARNGYTLPGDEELLRTHAKRLYIPGRR